jgi:hypothetical protein
VNKQLFLQTRLDEPECSPAFLIGNFFATGGISQCISNLNPM